MSADPIPDNPSRCGGKSHGPRDERKYVGMPVRKSFMQDGELQEFRGTVVDIDVDEATNQVIFGVQYDDGDSEDMDLQELQQCLCDPSGEHSLRSGLPRSAVRPDQQREDISDEPDDSSVDDDTQNVPASSDEELGTRDEEREAIESKDSGGEWKIP